MAEIRTVTTLQHKAAEIEAAIIGYEQKLAQARVDLSRVRSVIDIFENNSEAVKLPPYADLHRLFRRAELFAMCKRALAEGPRTTPALAEYVMAVKGLDVTDKVLRRAIAYRVVQTMGVHERQRHVVSPGKAKGGIKIWSLP